MFDIDEHSPRFRILAALTILLTVSGGLWAAFTLLWPEDDGSIAILKADNTPIKIRPDNPGGMQIPHQDKLVFNTVSNEGKMVTVERILPPPEQPMMPAAPTPTIQAVPPQPAQQNVIQQAAAMTQAQVQAQKVQPSLAVEPAPVALGRGVEPTPEANKSAPTKAIDAPAAFDMSKGDGTAPKKAEAVKEPEKKIEIEKSEPVAKQDETPGDVVNDESVNSEPEKEIVEEPKQAAPKGKAHFQIASFFDRPSAETSLKKLSAKYADALQGTNLFITEATIGNGKKVFRIQGGGDADAADICAAIKAKGGACVTLR